MVADRAEWMLVDKGRPFSLRYARPCDNATIQERLIRILAWQGDRNALPLLHGLQARNAHEHALIDWAAQKIEALSSSEP